MGEDSVNPQGGRYVHSCPRCDQCRCARHGVRRVAGGAHFPLVHESLYYIGVTATVAPAHADSLTRLGHALSDPTRTRILLLLTAEPRTPSQMVELLGASKQVISNQLACLRGCGLVRAERSGRQQWYHLVNPRLGAGLDELLRVTRVLDPTCCTGTECRCS